MVRGNFWVRIEPIFNIFFSFETWDPFFINIRYRLPFHIRPFGIWNIALQAWPRLKEGFTISRHICEYVMLVLNIRKQYERISLYPKVTYIERALTKSLSLLQSMFPYWKPALSDYIVCWMWTKFWHLHRGEKKINEAAAYGQIWDLRTFSNRRGWTRRGSCRYGRWQ